MTTSTEIQKLALDVFENKSNYKDNDYITILNILKESYMKVKGIVNDFKNEKEEEADEAEAEAEEEGVSRYANYDSEDDSDDESYTSSYLSPY